MFTLSRWPVGAVCALALLGGAARAVAQDERELARLVREIAAGNEEDREIAEQELIQKLAAPLAKAIGSLEERPVLEQLRLQRALGRVQAAIRIQIARASLAEVDRKLFDDFAQSNRELVEQLFADDPEARLSALRRIPLKPLSGAGVCIAIKVNDYDGDVADAALGAALQLKDVVVARCLAHYVESATAALKAGFFGPQDQDTAAVVASFVRRCIEVMGAAQFRDGVPVAAEALRQLGRSAYASPGFFELPPVAQALAAMGDKRATAALLDFLDHGGSSRHLPLAAGQMLTVTVGDEMLLALLQLHGQSPKDFGMTASGNGAFGYASDEARHDGHRRFRLWLREQGETPASAPARESEPSPRTP